jgi:hypothetical protein
MRGRMGGMPVDNRPHRKILRTVLAVLAAYLWWSGLFTLFVHPFGLVPLTIAAGLTWWLVRTNKTNGGTWKRS